MLDHLPKLRAVLVKVIEGNGTGGYEYNIVKKLQGKLIKNAINLFNNQIF